MNIDFKILVVDDTPELLDITIRVLKKANYNVISAASGTECLEALQREKPDIILLDVMLPDVNGKELAKKIKNNPEFPSVFIILLSSLRTSTEYIAEGLEDGADGYIVRPIENRELLARLASACRIINAERESVAVLQKYRSLFSSMEEGLYFHEMVYDEQNNPVDYRIIEANPASEKILNIKAEDAVGKLATQLYGTEEAPFLETYAALVKTGNTITFERYFAPLGKYFHISAYSSSAGKFATAFTDITERKQAEEKIRIKNEELLKSNTEKDKFFSIIAHDLKGPFGGFVELTKNMAERLPGMSFDEIQKYTLVMKKSASGLYHLLENLLEWSLMQRELITFNPESIVLNSRISEILVLAQQDAIKKEITISNSIPEDLVVFADDNMLGGIIRNLVTNAVKFTPKGGFIHISATIGEDNAVEFLIKDSGIGMKKDMIDDLFKLDVNTSRKGTEGESSTGLGLIICKDFVEKHGGKLWIESEEGKGSAFHILLPAEKT